MYDNKRQIYIVDSLCMYVYTGIHTAKGEIGISALPPPLHVAISQLQAF